MNSPKEDWNKENYKTTFWKASLESNFIVATASVTLFLILDLILRILQDAQEFDTRTWVAAVAIGKWNVIKLDSIDFPLKCFLTPKVLVDSDVSLFRREQKRKLNFNQLCFLSFILLLVMGTLLILTCGTCLVLYKECQENSGKPNLWLFLNALAIVLIFCVVFNIRFGIYLFFEFCSIHTGKICV